MIKITTDSTCDLPAQLLEQHHISVIPLGIVKGGELFRDGENITTADIAAHVDAGGDITTTNAVSIGDYEALFARESARNDAVIHLNIGIGFSCCHQNACLAAEGLTTSTWWIPPTSPSATDCWCFWRRRPRRPARRWRRFWPCWPKRFPRWK